MTDDEPPGHTHLLAIPWRCEYGRCHRPLQAFLGVVWTDGLARRVFCFWCWEQFVQETMGFVRIRHRTHVDPDAYVLDPESWLGTQLFSRLRLPPGEVA